MNIVVCVKQVPDTANVRFDAQDNIITDGLENIMNPCCSYAVENAIRIKETREGSKITVFSIGSPQAKEVLKRSIAMGCDDAYLLNDPAFNGADAIANAYLLAQAIKKYVPDFDIVLFGQFTDTGMSGITGPATAEYLGIPSLTLSNKAELKDDKTLVVQRESGQGMEVLEMSLPGLVCFANSEAEPRIPSIKGVMKANRTEIPVVDLATLNIEADQVGAAGSATYEASRWRKPRKEGGHKVDGSDPQVAVGELIAFLKEQKVV